VWSESKPVFWDHESWNKKLDATGSKPKPQPTQSKTEPQEPKATNEKTFKSKKTTENNSLPKWLLALLLIFTLSFIGLVINTLVGSIIPFWILFGFSVIFSIEKWFSYYTKKNRWLGRLYRLALNLGILSLLGLVTWSGIKLFSHQFVQSALIGSILFVAEFAFFIWVWRVVSKNSWRWPSMKLTVFTLICLFLVFAFAGVQPMSLYKDTALNKIQAAFSTENNNQPVTTYSNNPTTTSLNTTASVATTTHTNVLITTPSQTIATVQNIITGINSKTGVYKNYYLGLVNSSEGVIGGDGCYDDSGNFIVLINNKKATDPTYVQLVSFLQNDKTDQYPYIYTNPVFASYYPPAESHVNLTRIQGIIDGTIQPQNPDICADFAERLHNEAEKTGIRCAYVSIDLSGYPDPSHLGIPSNSGHALDAFQTTDRGLVYVDATGWIATVPHPSRSVATVNLVVGQQYIPVSLFPESGWQSSSISMGIVTNMEIFWDGRWNN
jgi:hypothetical protein